MRQAGRVLDAVLFGAALLAAAVLAASAAGAQPRRGNAGGVVGVEVAPGPRFKVTAVTFEALDETGWDWTGADEVVVIFQTRAYKLATREYGSINSDDTEHTFKRRDECIIPATDDGGRDSSWMCRPSGAPGPLSFIIAIYEQDDIQGGLLHFCSANLIGNDLRPPAEPTCPEEGDLIGRDNVDLSLAELLDRLRQPGAFFTDRLDLYGSCDATETAGLCETADGYPHYVVVYKVTRLPDAAGGAVDPTP